MPEVLVTGGGGGALDGLAATVMNLLQGNGNGHGNGHKPKLLVPPATAEETPVAS